MTMDERDAIMRETFRREELLNRKFMRAKGREKYRTKTK